MIWLSYSTLHFPRSIGFLHSLLMCLRYVCVCVCRICVCVCVFIYTSKKEDDDNCQNHKSYHSNNSYMHAGMLISCMRFNKAYDMILCIIIILCYIFMYLSIPGTPGIIFFTSQTVQVWHNVRNNSFNLGFFPAAILFSYLAFLLLPKALFSSFDATSSLCFYCYVICSPFLLAEVTVCVISSCLLALDTGSISICWLHAEVTVCVVSSCLLALDHLFIPSCRFSYWLLSAATCLPCSCTVAFFSAYVFSIIY